jgi:hypothetical protein
MGAILTDNFNRANGSPGSIPGGPAYEALSGAAAIASSRLLFSTSPDLNPIVALPVGRRMNGSCDVEVGGAPEHVYGNALYSRIVDLNNWIRMRVQTYRTSYQYYVTEYRHTTYKTEYEFGDYEAQPEWRVRYLEYEHYKTISASCSYSSWSGYVLQGTTACRDSAPPPQATVYDTHSGTNCGGAIKEYRVTANPLGQGCSATRRTYNHEYRTRSVTYTPASTTTTWTTSPTPPAGYLATGATRYAFGGTYYAWDKTGTYDVGTGNFRRWYTGSSYWATSAGSDGMGGYDSPSGATRQVVDSQWWATSQGPEYDGNTRQVGPYTGYTYYYGELLLEKKVSGVVTTLETYLTNTSSPKSMALRAKGSLLQMIWDGVVVDQVVDSTHETTGTKVGWGGGPSSWNPTNPAFDDAVVKILTPYKVRNSANNAWIDVPHPRVRNSMDTAWVDYDPVRY